MINDWRMGNRYVGKYIRQGRREVRRINKLILDRKKQLRKERGLIKDSYENAYYSKTPMKFKRIWIGGGNDFKFHTEAAFNLINQTSIYHGNMIAEYLNNILYVKHLKDYSSTHIHVINKEIHTRSVPCHNSLIDYARMLVHEAMHSKLYWDEFNRSSNYLVASKNCGGEFGERKCCREALHYLMTFRPYLDKRVEYENIERLLETKWWEK